MKSKQWENISTNVRTNIRTLSNQALLTENQWLKKDMYLNQKKQGKYCGQISFVKCRADICLKMK